MTRAVVAVAVLYGALCLPSLSHAQARCSRAELDAAVKRYLGAQAKGNTSGLKLATPVKYIEQMQDAAIDKGILRTPLKIDFHRSLLDVNACETFTEAIATDSSHPYVLGIRLQVVSGRLSEIETIVTDKDDWLFNADVYLKYSASEDWKAIPAAARDTRQALLAAANAYGDRFSDPKAIVPFGTPCNRLEGGIHSGKGTAEDSCSGGFPGADFPITNRRFVVDPDIGAVVVLSRFSKNNLPDSHLFRIEQGKIRFVHTLTVCTIPGCGFQAPTPSTPTASSPPSFQPSADATIQFDPKGVDLGPWVRGLVTRLKSQWSVPADAMSEKGQVVVTFQVLRNGSITDVALKEASSVEAYNKFAADAVSNSSPVTPLPSTYPDESVSFTVTFHYNGDGRTGLTDNK
ncbi:MAG TPA: TonB family protein [Vicinamibacterales bacterium]|jgi:TonB family protein